MLPALPLSLFPPVMRLPASVDLFCRVIDNFGDIGVCWRLARQLRQEHELAVCLWVDDLASFKRICNAIDPAQGSQRIEGIDIRLWDEAFSQWKGAQVADLVIEAFACELPEPYIEAMARASVQPAWINLEYLSAENWVEDCHVLPSPHPRLPLVKYFFFPGFSGKTGGLLLEQGLPQRRAAFQNDARVKHDFLAGLGVTPSGQGLLVSLFCYPMAPVTSLFSALAAGSKPVLCLVPEGVASEQVTRFLQARAVTGASARSGQLTVHIIPFLDQRDYDKLLWACDLNMVRGEDSVVRAQWAARPFVWQIYPQQEQAHWPKLKAFLACYAQALPAKTVDDLTTAWHAWNSTSGDVFPWENFRSQLPLLRQHTERWAHHLEQNGDLVSNLLRFIEKIG